MPIATSSDPADIVSVVNADADFLIFYSSIDTATNQMWCPDCIRVEHLVRAAFQPETAPSALIVWVGQRQDWRGKSENPFRGSPWNVSSVPTIRRRNGSRLVDEEINEESLAAFIKS